MKNRQLANVLGKGFPIATLVYLSSPHLLTNSFTAETTVLNWKAKSVKVWFHHPTAPRLHLWLGCTRLFGKGAMMSRHCFHGLVVGAIKISRLSFNNSPNRKTHKKKHLKTSFRTLQAWIYHLWSLLLITHTVRLATAVLTKANKGTVEPN